MRMHPISSSVSLRSYPYEQHSPFPFQRSSGRLRIRKVNKKIRLTFKHIILLFVLAGGLTYSVARGFLFLTTWDELTIRTVIVQTEQEKVREELTQLVTRTGLGNILLLDLKPIEALVISHRWVKRAQVRKIFPSSLKITVEERRPLAVVESASGSFLIAEDGVRLEALPPGNEIDLPHVINNRGTADLMTEELSLLQECFQALTLEERARIRLFDLSDPRNLILEFRDDPTRLLLGQNKFQEKLALYRKWRAWLEENFGALEYVDLRFFEDRIYFQPKTSMPGGQPRASPKEEN